MTDHVLIVYTDAQRDSTSAFNVMTGCLRTEDEMAEVRRIIMNVLVQGRLRMIEVRKEIGS